MCSVLIDPWANVLCVLEAPALLKISQKQYTFVMHLVDELGLFLDELERHKNETLALKQTISPENLSSSNNFQFSICVTTTKTFTLAVLDGLEDETINIPQASTSNLAETELESALRDVSEPDSIAQIDSTTNRTSKTESSTPVKTVKKSKFEENLQRGLEFVSKNSRGSSLASSMNMSDMSDETASQLDFTEYLDADLDASLYINETEQQKAARIEIDDDSVSLTDKNCVISASSATNESVN